MVGCHANVLMPPAKNPQLSPYMFTCQCSRRGQYRLRFSDVGSEVTLRLEAEQKLNHHFTCISHVFLQSYSLKFAVADCGLCPGRAAAEDGSGEKLRRCSGSNTVNRQRQGTFRELAFLLDGTLSRLRPLPQAEWLRTFRLPYPVFVAGG